MASPTYVDKQEFNEILDWCCKELSISAQAANKTPIAKMQLICNEFKTQIMHSLGDSSSVTSELLENNYTSNQQNIYKVGAVFLYQLRSFLTQDEILFNIGHYYKDKNGTQHLGNKYVEQNDIFNIKSLKGKITKAGFVIDKNLINVKTTDIINKSQNNLIKQVLNYAEARYDDLGLVETVIKSNGHKHKAYHNRKADEDALIMLSGSKHRITYYYLLGYSETIQYNKGWLYEWTNNYIAKNGSVALQRSMYHPTTPLRDLMLSSKRNNIQGLMGGDYKEKVNGRQRQIQSKLDNSKIISLINIYNSVTKIGEAINHYGTIYKSRVFQKELSSKFASTFTNAAINTRCDALINRQLRQLFN